MKILLIRLSSIGDVILTTPLLRCLKTQLPSSQLHVITKPLSAQLLQGNPFIDSLIEYDGSALQLSELHSQHYDCIIDLHNNHRSRRLRRSFPCRSLVYRKENFAKFILVLLKRDIMSGRHVVDRYFDAVKPLGVVNDGKGLELSPFTFQSPLFSTSRPFVVIACGAQHETKRIPPDKIALIANSIDAPVALLGDNSDGLRIRHLALSSNVVNLCGLTTLTESAAIISQASAVVTSDSAMMHVAAAYRRKVLALWGSTSPRFGFWAYATDRTDYTVPSLPCWPCRRMGSSRCPKGHFHCMMNQDYNAIVSQLKSILSAN